MPMHVCIAAVQGRLYQPAQFSDIAINCHQSMTCLLGSCWFVSLYQSCSAAYKVHMCQVFIYSSVQCIISCHAICTARIACWLHMRHSFKIVIIRYICGTIVCSVHRVNTGIQHNNVSLRHCVKFTYIGIQAIRCVNYTMQAH